MLKKETYVERRARLLKDLQGRDGVVLFLGNVDSAAQYRDNCYKWRQDSTFLYFVGLDHPSLAVVLDIESGKQTLFGDNVDIDDIIWSGPVPSVQDLAQSVGIEYTAPLSALQRALAGRKVHFAPVSRYYNALRLSELLGGSPAQYFSQGKAGCPAASEALVRAIIEQRLVKSAEEIALIDQACVLGQKMHTVARQGIALGKVEQSIVGAMEGIALAEGWGVSFPTILTQHGEIFHCHSHDSVIEPGKLMVIDAGLESNEHYASDFTRTYPTSGKFTAKQKEIYQIVSDCHDLAFSLTRPGVAYRDVHIAVAQKMLSGLKDLGLVYGDPAELAAEGVAGLFMPHGLGHNMGLDVHDMEDLGENLVGYDADQSRSSQLGLGSLRMARRLVPGNVITDEPGIYFIPALIEKWCTEGVAAGLVNYAALESYYDFGGIRLEDDVLVTEDGARRLGGQRLPATVSEIEEIMSIE